MVLWYHLAQCKPIGLGQAAMEVFFVLSGYLILRNLITATTKSGLSGTYNFAIRRMRRLLPAMIAFLIGVTLLSTTTSPTSLSKLPAHAFFALIGGYNFYQVLCDPSISGMGGIWSLSLEEQYYIVAIILILVTRACGFRPSTWGWVVASLLLTCGFIFRISAYAGWYKPGGSLYHTYLSYLPPLRFWGFGLGAFLVAIELSVFTRGKIVHWCQSSHIWLAALSCAGITCCIISVSAYNAHSFMFEWAIIPALTTLIIALAPEIDQSIENSAKGKGNPPP